MENYENYAQDHKIEALKNFTHSLNPQNIRPTRARIQRLLNGDAFFPIHSWPLKMQLIFTNTPLSDSDTFQFLLFMYGNGCPPEICLQHLCTSYYFCKDKRNKRIYQIKWIVSNLALKRHCWYYYDIHQQKTLFLNGTQKNR